MAQRSACSGWRSEAHHLRRRIGNDRSRDHCYPFSIPFDLQPVLKGRFVEPRPLRADDFDALYAVASDPLIWEQHPAHDRYRRDAVPIAEPRLRESAKRTGSQVLG